MINKGPQIHYTLSFPATQPGVVFESEGGQTSPRARLVYEPADKDAFVTELFVTAPGGELLSHVKGSLRRNS
ncbi:MAG: hypothetical protein ABSA01_03500 [Anaerolineales bacterium]|jgi:hypothetical protein